MSLCPYHQFVLALIAIWLFVWFLPGFLVGCFVDRFEGDETTSDRVALAAILAMFMGPAFLAAALIVAGARTNRDE